MKDNLKVFLYLLFGSLLTIGIIFGYKYFTTEKIPSKPVNEAQIVLDDIVEIEVGELGRLDANKSKGNSFVWKCIPEGISYEVFNDGKKLVFSSGTTGEYLCIVSSANNDAVDQKIIKIIVYPQGYDPDNPNPEPDINVGTLKGKILSWSMLVKSTSKVIEAQSLADGFDAVAVQIEAGTVNTSEGVETATRNAIHSALGESLTTWSPFLDNLQNYLKQEKLKGTLVTVEDYVKIWHEIANGLRQVRT